MNHHNDPTTTYFDLEQSIILDDTHQTLEPGIYRYYSKGRVMKNMLWQLVWNSTRVLIEEPNLIWWLKHRDQGTHAPVTEADLMWFKIKAKSIT